MDQEDKMEGLDDKAEELDHSIKENDKFKKDINYWKSISKNYQLKRRRKFMGENNS